MSSIHNKKENIWKIKTDLEHFGITEMWVQYNKLGYVVYIKVNLHRLISNDRIEVFSTSDYDNAANNFNAYMIEYHDKFDVLPFDKWKVSRIDYCVNIQLKDSDEVKKYIQLLHRGDIPRYYEHPVNKNTGKHEQYETSCYYHVGKSKNVNIYSKFDEMEAENKSSKQYKYNTNDLEAAKKILRLEVQETRRISAIIKKYGLSSRTLPELLRADISQHEILSVYERIAGKYSFYTLEKAKKIINQSTKSSNTKNNLCEFLNVISQIRNVYKARDDYKKQGVKTAPFIKHLGELQISPITIPADWGITCMPSLIDAITSSYEVVRL